MRYADTLLIEGEEVALRTRQHWLALLIAARWGVIAWLAALGIFVAVLLLRDRVPFFADGTVAWNATFLLVIGLLVVGALIILVRAWQWWAQDYMITSRRLMKVWGVLNKRSVDSALEKVNDARLDQSFFGRLLNYGHLDILTASTETDLDDYDMIKDPKGFKKVMLTQKFALEMSYGGGGVPAPPMRAAMDMNGEPATPTATPARPDTADAYVLDEPPAAAAPTPAEAPAATTGLPSESPPSAPSTEPATDRPADRSLEVTQTLARLADLRDSGVITEEEFAAKKQELLDRL
jgi:hypothetical protein